MREADVPWADRKRVGCKGASRKHTQADRTGLEQLHGQQGTRVSHALEDTQAGALAR